MPSAGMRSNVGSAPRYGLTDASIEDCPEPSFASAMSIESRVDLPVLLVERAELAVQRVVRRAEFGPRIVGLLEAHRAADVGERRELERERREQCGATRIRVHRMLDLANGPI